ncbi:hypothetical protein H0O03_02220 [Candidatus Micrarchaeota archaeon]|nr:hypothetical protein [Candidatus Micrarchaeota archaeon]
MDSSILQKEVAFVKARQEKALEALKQGFVREYVAITDASIDKLLVLAFSEAGGLDKYFSDTLYQTGTIEGSKLAEFLYQVGIIDNETKDRVRAFKNYRNFVLHQEAGEWSALMMKSAKFRDFRVKITRGEGDSAKDIEQTLHELASMKLATKDFAEHSAKNLQAGSDLVALLCENALALAK